jgi:hypothetical protein
VLYREFQGAHTIPDAVRAEAMEWFLPEKDRGA